jgi:hypothetical protein
MDPITKIAGAVEAVFTFLATPEGQALVKVWREDTQLFREDARKAAEWLKNLK